MQLHVDKTDQVCYSCAGLSVNKTLIRLADTQHASNVNVLTLRLKPWSHLRTPFGLSATIWTEIDVKRCP